MKQRKRFLVVSIFVLLAIMFSSFYVVNKMVKRTNWYQNIYAHTHQFDAPTEDKSLEIVNLGSNSALFSLFYEDVRGENWATGNQYSTMNFALLKTYQQRLSDSCVVLIPISQFTSCTPYLDKYASWNSDRYYARFVNILAEDMIPNYDHVKRWVDYPLWYNPGSWRYILWDSEKDDRLWITEQRMQLPELERDADKWMAGWMREFDIDDLNAPLDKEMDECHEECARRYAEIVKYCKEHGYKPYLMIPPMSRVLAERFSDKTKETYIYSFIRRIQKITEVECLDYLTDKDFSDPVLYFNSFFLNYRGRILFTRRVLSDIGLSSENNEYDVINGEHFNEISISRDSILHDKGISHFLPRHYRIRRRDMSYINC